uniref:Arylacetamide deacetylase-like n=1 Tax=Saccoglossus kowalevskii TaxID=10224 RepID=A0ABM0M8Y0_SACKO|nr:PREDICTED: arylacetamide deacetylase-like [Saccoglossus kowalevskii]
MDRRDWRILSYRRAPEHPFPIPLQDVVKATLWFLQHSKNYNVDPHRIVVVGDSAGGNMAAATASLLTFNEEYKQLSLPELKFQGLIYPCLQSIDFLTPSYQQNKKYFRSKSTYDEFKQRAYTPPNDSDFGDLEISAHLESYILNPFFAPLMASTVKGLPLAYIVTAEFDVLRDDGIFYAKKLEDGNVPVT